MTKLSDHHSSKIFKSLYIGDSSVGKTGSLVSLVKAGYFLRILDLDNGLDVLKQYIIKECPDKINNVDYETRRDKYKSTAGGPIVVGQPRAFVDSMALLTKWTDGSDPSQWGSDTFFVLDSGTALGRGAFEWAKGMNPSAKDPRQWYFQAQQAIETFVTMLFGEGFATNVLLITHINYKELQDGTTRGYSNWIGSALGPIIPKYCNTVLMAKSEGSGKNVRRYIETMSTPLVDLKNPAPFKIEQRYPLETGLATIVQLLKENTNANELQRSA